MQKRPTTAAVKFLIQVHQLLVAFVLQQFSNFLYVVGRGVLLNLEHQLLLRRRAVLVE